MVQGMMDFGKMISFMDVVDLSILMDQYIMENGRQGGLMVLGYRHILMEVDMKDHGKIICIMVKD